MSYSRAQHDKLLSLESKKGLAAKAEELKHHDHSNKASGDIIYPLEIVNQTPEKSLRHNEISSVVSKPVEQDLLKEFEDIQPFQKRVWGLFIAANAILNYDTGVIPASLIQIQEEIQLDHQKLAAIGTLVYIGYSIASVLVTNVFQHFKAKKVIAFTLLLNAVFCWIFSESSNLMVLYGCRIAMGFLQAFCSVYGPVWINEFAPPDRNTFWMGVLQANSAIGVMVGYVITALLVNLLPGYSPWRLSIKFQAIGILPIMLGFLLTSNNHIDVLNREEEDGANAPRRASVQMRRSTVHSIDDIRMDGISFINRKAFWEQVKTLSSNFNFVVVTFGLCSLYYVVTGIQFWGTKYLVQIVGMTQKDANICFGITALTAPLMGVSLGGYLADKLGGYKGENLLTAIKLCSAFALLAVLVSFPCAFAIHGAIFIPLLWTLLFTGACIIPAGTGIIVDSVSREYQASSSSFSQLIFNIFGFFAAPVFSAFFMDFFEDETEGLIWGFRVVLAGSVLGLLYVGLAWYHISKNLDQYIELQDDFDLNGMSKAEIQYEVSRRRATSLM